MTYCSVHQGSFQGPTIKRLELDTGSVIGVQGYLSRMCWSSTHQPLGLFNIFVFNEGRYSELDITTILVPTPNILHANGIQSLEQAMVNFCFRHCCHCQANILSMATEVILHAGKCQLN